MSTPILILTSARATESPHEYLERTVAEIDREDLSGPRIIVCDGAYKGPEFKGWTVDEFHRAPTEIKGNKLPYWRLLELGVREGGDFLAFEDDLTFCFNAIRRMTAFHVPRELAWVQFFSPTVIRKADTFPGLWRPPLYSHLFLQAVKWTRDGGRKMLSWREDGEFVAYAESDQAVNLAGMRYGMRYGVHCPDLVNHVGHTSLASGGSGLDEWRTSNMFSKGLDALSLYKRDDLYR